MKNIFHTHSVLHVNLNTNSFVCTKLRYFAEIHGIRQNVKSCQESSKLNSLLVFMNRSILPYVRDQRKVPSAIIFSSSGESHGHRWRTWLYFIRHNSPTKSIWIGF
jgi:hypothetical protein